ncbi:hypothetical protein Mal15_33220 [Stieleria maiorica]|uniref:Ice-binding protein C-terminal domain-containing protein n=1 Tax=Stieleria maiorica TaxID=2795974 RepID=A0A5B9MH05_9BACT|nr:choice-of-anchor M domain-containing protein [Stieleria maiorica]QEF99260.1 hypothetical protein Mal15_33220 [Stieleria maiorica]
MNRFIITSARICLVGVVFAFAGNAAADVVEYSAGHSDIGLAYEDGELHLHYHFGSDAILDGNPTGVVGGVEYDPSEAVVRVTNDALYAGGAPGPISFLGLDTGDPVWILPQSNAGGLPFLGIATEELDAPFNSASFEMTGFSGPGQFALWQGGFTPSVFMQTNDGVIGGPSDTLSIAGVGSHDHYNWGFTEEGVYDIQLTATAFNSSLPGGFATDTGTFRFVVGNVTAIPEPSSFAAIALAATGFLVRRRRA